MKKLVMATLMTLLADAAGRSRIDGDVSKADSYLNHLGGHDLQPVAVGGRCATCRRSVPESVYSPYMMHGHSGLLIPQNVMSNFKSDSVRSFDDRQ
jgi:hypothetical protein